MDNKDDLLRRLYENYISILNAYRFIPLSYTDWMSSGRAERELKHFQETGYMPGQRIN